MQSDISYIKGMTEGEPFSTATKEKESEVSEVENDHEHAPQDTKPIPITIVKPITKTVLEVDLIESSSRPQPTGLVIDIIPPEQSNLEDQLENQSHTTPKADRGKGIARDTNESPCKLVKASTKVRQDLNALVLIPYEINEVLLMQLSKLELIKVVIEVATEARVDPKALQSSKGGQEFLKQQDDELNVLKRECLESI
ncbi:hypothetical protein Tco_0960288 [Tanacetum coccineum]